MIYQGANMELSPIWEVFHGEVNDVVVCRDLKSPVGMRYTVMVIRDRNCVRTVLRVLEQSEQNEMWGTSYVTHFAQNELMCFVFSYRENRHLADFASGQMVNSRMREQISINLIMECLSAKLPFPLLYLVLTQEGVHIEKDNSIYFTYYLDLSKLDESCTEGYCVSACIDLLIEMLEGKGRGRGKLRSYQLLAKKRRKNAYNTLSELYRDVKVTALPEIKESRWKQFKASCLRHRDATFRLLLVACVILILITGVMLISQLIFGDIPLFKLFEAAFEQIGTETLKD